MNLLRTWIARRRLRGGRGLARVAGGLLALALAVPAAAVILTVTNNTGSSNYQLMLRVGSASGTDTVNFGVSGNNLDLNPAPVTGTPDIDVWVLPLRPSGSTTTARPVTLTVDSSAPLQCQTPASCGTTTIPFGKISWQASNNSSGGAGDIQAGSFSGTATQPIAGFNANATVCDVWFIICWSWLYQTQQLNATRMRFIYANDQLYPAGSYRGTVRFTATMQ